MKLWNRDYRILKNLASNYHSVSQIAETYFPSRTKASRRMKKLFDSAYVSRFPKPTLRLEGRQEYIYAIAKKGLKALAMQGIQVNLSVSKRRPNAYSVEHTLFLNDIKLWFGKVAEKNRDTECRFVYGKRFYPDGLKGHGIEPDAYLLMTNRKKKKQLLHFIEIELGNEMLESGKFRYSFADKIEKYCGYFDSNAYVDDFKNVFGFCGKGFRVLVMVKGRQRLARLLQMSFENDAGFFWFCALEDISEKTILENIWSYADKEKQALIGWAK
jgi:hypothetical protein